MSLTTTLEPSICRTFAFSKASATASETALARRRVLLPRRLSAGRGECAIGPVDEILERVPCLELGEPHTDGHLSVPCG
jgi:hypothetical protein